jgi:hypothetical protein
VRTVSVVVLDVGSEHSLEVAAVGDRQPVEALPAHGPDEALGDLIGLRRFDRGADDLDPLAAEDLVEGTAEPGVVVADQVARRSSTVRELPGEVSCLPRDPGAVGVPGHTGEVDPTGRDLGWRRGRGCAVGRSCRR